MQTSLEIIVCILRWPLRECLLWTACLEELLLLVRLGPVDDGPLQHVASSGATSSSPASLITQEVSWASEPLRFNLILQWDASYSGDGTSTVDRL